ncbi:hypothetical protein JL101_032945 (plasmid) [Skermanella rosea]|uniref:hypothetical protein n=1 Tax=Skermanella rosea TaxID=1817965 RepID=UPI001933E152|nr:hypothetical protein [Skermanella rosea]UEM07294.1 hypothetical protein JL101_032945 [Skermanella rosea]
MNSAFRTLFNPSTPYTASAPDLARLAGGDARSLRSVDGQVWPVSTIRLGGGRILVTVEDRSAPTGMDLTERRDALTGLANRVVLKERIVQMLAEPGKDLQAALFLLDLDRIPK